jgi:transcriptional regulator with XRE-family HTH domain
MDSLRRTLPNSATGTTPPPGGVRTLSSVISGFSGSAIVELAAQAGVSKRVARQAANGRRISAEPYLMLCCALGVDPCTGLPRAAATQPKARCNWARLAYIVRSVRSRRGHGIRAAAEFVGLSTATISRTENAKPVAIETVLLLVSYSGMSAESMLGFCSHNETVTEHVAHETGSPCTGLSQSSANKPTPSTPGEQADLSAKECGGAFGRRTV